ncbi:hypothetical protein [Arthrobacter sp. MYb227]
MAFSPFALYPALVTGNHVAVDVSAGEKQP